LLWRGFIRSPFRLHLRCVHCRVLLPRWAIRSYTAVNTQFYCIVWVLLRSSEGLRAKPPGLLASPTWTSQLLSREVLFVLLYVNCNGVIDPTTKYVSDSLAQPRDELFHKDKNYIEDRATAVCNVSCLEGLKAHRSLRHPSSFMTESGAFLSRAGSLEYRRRIDRSDDCQRVMTLNGSS